MFKLKCGNNNCTNMLMLDHQKTLEYYLQAMQFVIKPRGGITYENLPLITYYRCPKCSKEYSFDVKEYERRVRVTMADMALRIKSSEMLSELNYPHDIDPDNGLEHCGICRGYDNEGNCFSDMIKKCPLRELYNEKLSPIR